jgi:hypothetical protein
MHSSFLGCIVPSLVLKTVGVMHLAQRAFEAFAHLILDIILFVEQRVFSKMTRS